VIVNTDPLHGAPTGAPNLRLIPAINMALLTECWTRLHSHLMTATMLFPIVWEKNF